MRSRSQFSFAASILVLVVAAPAGASELCVKCTGPDASYACVVGEVSNATLDTVSKFYCITSLAKSGSHASCAIDRNSTPPCPGQRRELPIPAFLNAPDNEAQPEDASSPEQHEPNAAVKSATAPPPPNPPAPTAPPDENAPHAATNGEPPPKTVQEMVEKSPKWAGDGLSQTQKSAGEAAKSASTALEKAGSAVGGAAKSSWKCLSSFFSNC